MLRLRGLGMVGLSDIAARRRSPRGSVHGRSEPAGYRVARKFD